MKMSVEESLSGEGVYIQLKLERGDMDDLLFEEIIPLDFDLSLEERWLLLDALQNNKKIHLDIVLDSD